jgi:uncharacterized protein YgbK (DUF1537 family)
MTPYAIIADDFTGAGDSGIHFAAAGKKTALLLDNASLAETLANHDAVAVSTETRFLPPHEAGMGVRAIVRSCRQPGPKQI